MPGAARGAAAGVRGGGRCGTQSSPCGTQSPPRSPAPTSASSGGSLEDRIAAFFREQLRQVEQELETAMKEAERAGQNGQGDSRSAAANKVQQLVNKRSEMIEMLTNAQKALHESSMAVNRNIK
jgi:hypothetical protein